MCLCKNLQKACGHVCATYPIDKIHVNMYDKCVRQRRQPLTKGSEDLDEMTTAELNQFLENIAKLIEATAKDTKDAAKIVRDSKVKA